MNAVHDIPGTHYATCHVAPLLTADATAVVGIVIAPFRAVVASVEFIPHTSLSGTDTASRTFGVLNGSTSVASLALASGVDLTALTAKTITLSATAANLNVAAGDVLEIRGTKVGNGLALPEGICRIGFQGR